LREAGSAVRRENCMKIAFIGFGEAARAFAETLRGDGLSFSAYDILTRRGADGDVRQAASRLGVALADEPAKAVSGADWVISAVTASDSLEAAQSVAAALKPNQVYLDINSVSAGRKQATATLVGASGCDYVDMAVMAPVHPRGHRTPVLIAGPDCAAVEPDLRRLGFDWRVVGGDVGGATSIKMLRSLFVKGLEAITVQTLLAAQQAGRFDEVYESVSKSFAALGWPDFPLYQLERVATHGVRRAAEMRESAATLDELGFAAGRDLATAIADLQQSVGELGWKKPAAGDPAASFAALAERLSRDA
jgi:3-hydroxyisobutyrate dehydrogenase-like beta-hydroxyacid dehydrogenase